MNVYTKFARADGHTVWLHMDQWEGQNWKRSPGNIYGDAGQDHLRSEVVDADQARRRQGDSADRRFPRDNDYVKRIKIQSQILTKWWGQPIYLGATVLLPKDYDKHPDVKYPVVYDEGHFSLGAPGGSAAGGTRSGGGAQRASPTTGTPTARRG